MSKDYSEDQLIQKSTADFLEKELGNGGKRMRVNDEYLFTKQ